VEPGAQDGGSVWWGIFRFVAAVGKGFELEKWADWGGCGWVRGA
jgi:hypothetical protein